MLILSLLQQVSKLGKAFSIMFVYTPLSPVKCLVGLFVCLLLNSQVALSKVKIGNVAALCHRHKTQCKFNILYRENQ